MLDEAISHFAETALGPAIDTWDADALKHLARLEVPAGTTGSLSWLVDADTRVLWARWLLESLCDPAEFASGFSYPHLFARVRAAVVERTTGMPADEQSDVTKRLANLLRPLLAAQRPGRRTPWSRETRLLLRELYQRCWVCGSSFPSWAEARFLGNETDVAPAAYHFVDFLRPRGTIVAELQIEVDHVHAFSTGGTEDIDNLRLACGWCNRHKSARSLVYDAPATCRRYEHPKRGLVSVPQPFWTVRTLAVRGRCEHPEGCPARTTSHELTVVPRHLGGSPNPANLMIVCADHDPLRDVRLVPAQSVRRLTRTETP